MYICIGIAAVVLWHYAIPTTSLSLVNKRKYYLRSVGNATDVKCILYSVYGLACTNVAVTKPWIWCCRTGQSNRSNPLAVFYRKKRYTRHYSLYSFYIAFISATTARVLVLNVLLIMRGEFAPVHDPFHQDDHRNRTANRVIKHTVRTIVIESWFSRLLNCCEEIGM